MWSRILLDLFAHVARILPRVSGHQDESGQIWLFSEQLSRDFDVTSFWKAWYLAMGRDGWREFAMILGCLLTR